MRKFLRYFILCALAGYGLALLVGWWWSATISIADVLGTYRAVVPDGEAVLEVKEGDKWDYRLDGKSFRRSGTWSLEAEQTPPSTIAIGFENFDLGFPLDEILPRGPSYFLFYFEAYRGKIRTCIEDLGPKWGPMGRICFVRD